MDPNLFEQVANAAMKALSEGGCTPVEVILDVTLHPEQMTELRRQHPLNLDEEGRAIAPYNGITLVFSEKEAA